MIKDKRNIDKLFEEGLKKFKEQPPVYAWDKLDKSLDKAGFKKSMVYLRWLAASILIILAFGSGYYFAVYNLSTPEIANDINISTSPIQDSELDDPQVKADKRESFTENYKEQQSNNVSAQDENIVQLTEENTLFSSNDNSLKNENEIISQSTASNDMSAQYQERNKINGMNIIDIANIPVNLQFVSPLFIADEQPLEAKKEIAITNPPTMSIYYNPEDYNLKPTKSELATKWAVGAQFAPVVSYRDISINYGNQQGNIINDDESQLNNNEESLISYAGGVDVNYNVSKRWSIQSGLYYSRIGQVNNDALNFKQDKDQYQLFSINTSTGDINIAFEKVPDNVKNVTPPKDTLESIDIGNVKIVQNFDVFEVPFMIKYKILDKRFGINLSGGLSPGYLVSNSTYLEVENNKHDIGSSDNLNPMIVNTSFSLGLNYGITKNLKINFEPTFKYSLSPMNNNSQFDYHPYYFSWYTGIRYSF